MAEAVVEERPSVHARFYCHMCNVEINIPNTDYTCPLCSGGFVEELPPPSTPTTTTTNVPASTSTSNSNNSGGVADQQQHQQRQQQQQQQQRQRYQQHYQHQPPLPLDMDVLRNELATLLASRNGPNLEISIDPGNGRVNTRGNLLSLVGNGTAGAGTGTAMGTGTGTGTGNASSSSTNNTGGGRARPQNLDNVLLNFLLSISGETEMPPFGTPPMVFMGNLGDYAWGREGLDTIVTQLLNQMETSGPPPLSKQKINEIPKVGVSAEEVERKLQCSVCWEDFILDELVRKLPCSHLYHEECIIPWLDLHGTCPICRKLLNDDDDDDISMENQEFIPTHSCPVHGISSNDNAANATATATTATTANANANVDATSTNNRTRNMNSTTTTTNNNNDLSSNETAAAAAATTSQISQRIFRFDDMDFSNSDLD